MDDFYSEESFDMENHNPAVRWQASQMDPFLRQFSSRTAMGRRSMSSNDIFTRDRESRPSWSSFGPDSKGDPSGTAISRDDPVTPEASHDDSQEDRGMFTLASLTKKAKPKELGQARRVKQNDKGQGRAVGEPSLSRKPSLMDIDTSHATAGSVRSPVARNASMPTPEIPSDRRQAKPAQNRAMDGIRLTRKPSLIDIDMDSPRGTRTGDPNSMPPPPVPVTLLNPQSRSRSPIPGAVVPTVRNRGQRPPMTKSLSSPNAFPQPFTSYGTSSTTSHMRNAGVTSTSTSRPSSSATDTNETDKVSPPATAAPSVPLPQPHPSQGLAARPRAPPLGMRRAVAYGIGLGSQAIASSQSNHDVAPSQQLPTKRRGFKPPLLNQSLCGSLSNTFHPPVKPREKSTAQPSSMKRSASSASTSSHSSNSTAFTGISRPGSQTSEEGEGQAAASGIALSGAAFKARLSKEKDGRSPSAQTRAKRPTIDDDSDLWDDPNDDSYGDLIGIEDDLVIEALSAYD